MQPLPFLVGIGNWVSFSNGATRACPTDNRQLLSEASSQGPPGHRGTREAAAMALRRSTNPTAGHHVRFMVQYSSPAERTEAPAIDGASRCATRFNLKGQT